MINRLPAVIIFFIFVFLYIPALPAGSERAVRKPKIDIALLEREIHDLINGERGKQGLSALAWNKQLILIARSHSRDMVKRRYFAHESPEGRTFPDRYREQGFLCRIRKGNTIYSGAENISQDSLFSSILYRNGVPAYNWNSREAIARSVVRRWMESPGHRKNILTPSWKTEGIGISIGEDGKILVTENFC